MNPAQYAKALAAAVGAGLGVLYFALDDGAVTAQEWVGVVQTALATGLGVYGIPNQAVARRRQV